VFYSTPKNQNVEVFDVEVRDLERANVKLKVVKRSYTLFVRESIRLFIRQNNLFLRNSKARSFGTFVTGHYSRMLDQSLVFCITAVRPSEK
jgi:hypothetical protein